MPYANTNGIRTYYEEDGASEPLVLIHGYSGDLTMWLRLRPELAPHFRVICYDMRGHGRTDTPQDPDQYSMAGYADDLRDLLTALNLRSAHVVGASMGGMVALEFAFHYPEMIRGLVLSDTSAGPSCTGLSDGIRAREEEIQRTESYAAEHGIEALALHQLESGRVPAAVRNDPFLRERFISRMRSLTTHGFVNAGRARRQRTDYHDRLDELDLPVLVVAGERDVLVPAAHHLHDHIRGSRLTIIADAGHPAVTDQPLAFSAAVLSFLTDIHENKVSQTTEGGPDKEFNEASGNGSGTA